MEINLKNNIGVWMDYTHAHLVDVSRGNSIVETIYSDKESHLRFKGEGSNDMILGNNRSTNDEHHQHRREEEITNQYYEVLAGVLKKYDCILLFGPTHAKEELFNQLIADKHFEGKTIHVESADKMSENELVAKVKEYYNK